MHIYLKGYYGYQNLGDELLLIGVLNWIQKSYAPQKIVIEAGDPLFLKQRLDTCKKFVKTEHDKIFVVSKAEAWKYSSFFTIFGGGEVVSDARSFPWNGRTYLWRFWKIIWHKNYILLGGIGTPQKPFTNLLYRIFLGRAKRVVVRDTTSFTVAERFTSCVELYHDFCYDFLETLELNNVHDEPYVLINNNIYLWNDTVVDTIRQGLTHYPHHTVYMLPAARGSDDTLFARMKEHIPGLQLLDRRDRSPQEIVSIIAGAKHVFATRLHVLLIAQWAGVAITPFVYQEKITKCIINKQYSPA